MHDAGQRVLRASMGVEASVSSIVLDHTNLHES